MPNRGSSTYVATYYPASLNRREALGVIDAHCVFDSRSVFNTVCWARRLLWAIKGSMTFLPAEEAFPLVDVDLGLRGGVLVTALLQAVRARHLPIRPSRSTNWTRSTTAGTTILSLRRPSPLSKPRLASSEDGVHLFLIGIWAERCQLFLALLVQLVVYDVGLGPARLPTGCDADLCLDPRDQLIAAFEVIEIP